MAIIYGTLITDTIIGTKFNDTIYSYGGDDIIDAGVGSCPGVAAQHGPMSQCPQCSSPNTNVLESRRLLNGSRRRRYQCSLCSHRWSSYEGRTSPSPEQIREILLSDESDQAVARQIGRSIAVVRLIRIGEVYSELWPEIPRRRRCGERQLKDRPQPQAQAITCLSCQHWSHDRCSMGFPDPELEGVGFAADCETFLSAPLP